MQSVRSFFSTQWGRYRAARRGAQVGIGCLALVLVCGLCSLGTAALPSPSANTANVAPVTTATSLVSATVTQSTATVQPKPTATHAVPTATPRPQPTQVPPTATPAPRYPAINGNPWDYTLTNTGNLLYNPNSDVCAYLNCIPSFWQHTNGYVDECVDGTFSHSGGVRGACSYHGGESQPVYQP